MKSVVALQHIQTRLFLHAVFPTLDCMIKASPKAQALLKDNKFSLCFRTRSGLHARYFFSDKGCEYTSGDSRTMIELFFLSDAHAAKTFLEEGGPPPIPTRGFGTLGKMKTFIALTKELESWLKPEEAKLADEDFRAVFAPMSLALAMRGVCQLCVSERKSREWLASGPQGVAVFQIGENGKQLWIQLVSNQLESGSGQPPKPADVRIIFKNSQVAAEAVLERLDSMAAVGRGDIKIVGMAPLADHLNALMERLQGFIDPPK
ncbi:hypothetical protein [Cerasicoccus fimbriatus]|uniref:hypothetical protein n=1 Tax=Cerasicoccus fimbriatus TaxID=3014554 RepID=UPI0022B4256A|nr:hypothetical protein [Cerasicoccus sp. TK19100]